MLANTNGVVLEERLLRPLPIVPQRIRIRLIKRVIPRGERRNRNIRCFDATCFIVSFLSTSVVFKWYSDVNMFPWQRT